MPPCLFISKGTRETLLTRGIRRTSHPHRRDQRGNQAHHAAESYHRRCESIASESPSIPRLFQSLIHSTLGYGLNGLVRPVEQRRLHTSAETQPRLETQRPHSPPLCEYRALVYQELRREWVRGPSSRCSIPRNVY